MATTQITPKPRAATAQPPKPAPTYSHYISDLDNAIGVVCLVRDEIERKQNLHPNLLRVWLALEGAVKTLDETVEVLREWPQVRS